MCCLLLFDDVTDALCGRWVGGGTGALRGGGGGVEWKWRDEEG